jgi:hypothetical protein
MDLLQEHNIKQLKKMSQRRDAGFGSSFFKEIISFNIRAFLQVNATMKTAVRLGAKGASHQQKKKAAAMKELSMAMTEKELHKYRGGRTFDHVAADDFECGFTKLTSGNKIKDFINRTLAGSEADGSDEEDEHDPTGLEDFADNDNLPSIIIDGILLNDDAGDMENDVDDSDESSGSEI